MELLLIISAVLLGLLLVITFITPNVIEYDEYITIQGTYKKIFDAIRFQEQLMQWSAWPKETNTACYVTGPDGEVGARTMFGSEEKPMGHQEVTRIADNRIYFSLEGPGVPHTPSMFFEVDKDASSRIEVLFHFKNVQPRPFNLIWKYAGLNKWTRGMHQKDLHGLKTFIESA